jgi:hypothetical protein
MTTLGYGDVRPSVDARLVAASEALFGYIWMAVFIGLFAAANRHDGNWRSENACKAKTCLASHFWATLTSVAGAAAWGGIDRLSCWPFI